MTSTIVDSLARVRSKRCTKRQSELHNVPRLAKEEKCHRLHKLTSWSNSLCLPNTHALHKSLICYRHRQKRGSLVSMQDLRVLKRAFGEPHHVSETTVLLFVIFIFCISSWGFAYRLSITRQNGALHWPIRAIPIPKECLLQLQTELPWQDYSHWD